MAISQHHLQVLAEKSIKGLTPFGTSDSNNSGDGVGGSGGTDPKAKSHFMTSSFDGYPYCVGRSGDARADRLYFKEHLEASLNKASLAQKSAN